MNWKLTWDGRVWASTEMTIAHAIAVGVLLGRHEWLALEPPRSPEFVHAWLLALLANEVGMPRAMELVNGAPMQALVDAVVIDEE